MLNKILSEPINKFFKVVNLQKEELKFLNGKIGKCTGFDVKTLSLDMKFDDDSQVYKIFATNLTNWNQKYEKIEPKDVASLPKELIKRAILHVKVFMANNPPKGRVDSQNKYQILKKLVENYQKGNYQEYIPCGYLGQVPQTPYYIQLTNLRNDRQCRGNGKFILPTLLNGNAETKQIQLRIKEFLLSGFCLACMHFVFERFNGVPEQLWDSLAQTQI